MFRPRKDAAFDRQGNRTMGCALRGCSLPVLLALLALADKCAPSHIRMSLSPFPIRKDVASLAAPLKPIAAR